MLQVVGKEFGHAATGVADQPLAKVLVTDLSNAFVKALERFQVAIADVSRTRDEFVIVRKMKNVDWLERPYADARKEAAE